MELKDYQQQALDTLDRYLEALKAAHRQVAEISAFDLSTRPPIVWESTNKQKLIETLETAYRNAAQHGTIDITAPNNKTMSFRMLFEDSWRETVSGTIANAYLK